VTSLQVEIDHNKLKSPIKDERAIRRTSCKNLRQSSPGIGLTLGVLTSSTRKFCSRRHADWGKVKASAGLWGAAGERSRQTPCGSKPTWAEPPVGCRELRKQRLYDIKKCKKTAPVHGPKLNNILDNNVTATKSKTILKIQIQDGKKKKRIEIARK